MAQTEAQKRAIQKYHAANYEYIHLRLNKGERDIVKAKAAEAGLSINEYIRLKCLE